MLQRLWSGQGYLGRLKVSIPKRNLSKKGAVLVDDFNKCSGVDVCHNDLPRRSSLFLGRDPQGRDLFVNVRGMSRRQFEEAGHWDSFYDSIPKPVCNRKIPTKESIGPDKVFAGFTMMSVPLFK